jgi:hypothetical protein
MVTKKCRKFVNEKIHFVALLKEEKLQLNDLLFLKIGKVYVVVIGEPTNSLVGPRKEYERVFWRR